MEDNPVFSTFDSRHFTIPLSSPAPQMYVVEGNCSSMVHLWEGSISLGKEPEI